MPSLILHEGRPVDAACLPPGALDALIEAGVVTAESRDGAWMLRAGSRVGVVSMADLQVIIQPKVDMSRIVFLMTYARRPEFWRDDLVRLAQHANPLEAIVHAFIAVAQRVLEQGVLKGYVTVQESLPVLRGRILERKQLRRRFGRAHPLEVRHDEYAVDTAENRLLLLAIERLLRLPRPHPPSSGGAAAIEMAALRCHAPPRRHLCSTLRAVPSEPPLPAGSRASGAGPVRSLRRAAGR